LPITSRENKAYYSPEKDLINMPAMANFKSIDGMYATLFHEIVHSTGHHSRLKRFEDSENVAFGSASYSKEELVAEFGAAYLCGFSGIEKTIENQAAYIAGWLSRLKSDSTLLIQAAGKAQKAVNFLTGRKSGYDKPDGPDGGNDNDTTETPETADIETVQPEPADLDAAITETEKSIIDTEIAITETEIQVIETEADKPAETNPAESETAVTETAVTDSVQPETIPGKPYLAELKNFRDINKKIKTIKPYKNLVCLQCIRITGTPGKISYQLTNLSEFITGGFDSANTENYDILINFAKFDRICRTIKYQYICFSNFKSADCYNLEPDYTETTDYPIFPEPETDFQRVDAVRRTRTISNC